MVEMFIYKVGIDRQGRTIVLLADEKTQTLLPILIGLFEARAIAAELGRDELGPPARPMTHDLMVSVFQELGCVLEKITVTKIEDDVFYAILSLVGGDRRYEIDARPSDSLALAVRTGARIFVDESVLAKAQVVIEEENEEDIERFKQLLGDVGLDAPQTEEPEEGAV
jgi:bifunctional DNase/RNase